MSISGYLNGTQNENDTAQCLRSVDPEMDLDCCTTGVCLWFDFGQPTDFFACDKNNHCILTNSGIVHIIIYAIVVLGFIGLIAFLCLMTRCCGLFEDCYVTRCCDFLEDSFITRCRGLFENQVGQAARGRPSNIAQSSGLPKNVVAYGQNVVAYSAAYHREGSPSVSGEESVSGEGSPASYLANSAETGSITAGTKEKIPKECSDTGEGSHSNERSHASALTNSVDTGSIKAGTKEKIPKECFVSSEGSTSGERFPSGERSPSGEGSPASALTNSAETGSIKAGTKEKIPKECSVSPEGSPSGERSPASALTNSVDTGSIKAGTKGKIPREFSVSPEGSPYGERSPASALTNSAETGSIKAETKEKIPKECSIIRCSLN